MICININEFEILLQSTKSALLILNFKEANTNYGYGVWNPCHVDKSTISKIHSLRDKSRGGVFGNFDHVIMAQDFQCLDESNQTNSNMTDVVISSTLKFEYSENGQLCEGNYKQVIQK